MISWHVSSHFFRLMRESAVSKMTKTKKAINKSRKGAVPSVADVHLNLIRGLEDRCLKVLASPCPICNSRCTPEEPYEYLLVVIVTEDNMLEEEEVYIISVNAFSCDKRVTFELGSDGGKDRVSFQLPVTTHYFINILFLFQLIN